MIFDDRLETVLRNRPASAEAGYIQYLQLIDLLGRRAENPAIPDEALDRLAELEHLLPVEQRGMILQSSAPLLRHAGLVLRLASQPLPVADVAIGAARLSDADWAALIGDLPPHARTCLRRRSDLGQLAREALERFATEDLEAACVEPAEQRPSVPADEVERLPGSVPNAEGIAAIVRRIEALRRTRGSEPALRAEAEEEAPVPRAERLPPVTAAAFLTDAAGVIVEADHECGPMLVGLTLGQRGPAAPARCTAEVCASMASRRAVVAGRARIEGAPRIAGAWRIDAAPRFDSTSGGFLGYAGMLRRPIGPKPRSEAEKKASRLEALQALHELRTPLNGIVGCAEFIHQQLLGPVPHRYVSHAAALHADAAEILAALEEIGELCAEPAEGNVTDETSDAAVLLRHAAAQLEDAFAAEGIGFALEGAETAPVQWAEDRTARLLSRFMTLVAGAADEGERLRFALSGESENVVITAHLPDAWSDREATARRPTTGPSLLGRSFAVMSIAAEAARGGGTLRQGEDRLVLQLPGPRAEKPHRDADVARQPIAADVE